MELSQKHDSTETCLDNLIIRDATEQEKEELKILAEEGVMNMDSQIVDQN